MGIFSFLFKKQKMIETLIYTYLDNISLAEDNFLKAFDVYFEKGKCSKESREDILELLESIDMIPNCCQRILYMIQTQNLIIPSFLYPDMKELIEISLESCLLMRGEVKALFEELKKLQKLTIAIDQNESRCDQIERGLISRLFNSDLDTYQKILIKELILEMGDITDRTNRVSRQINIISIKRRV
jgi:predicted phosphate transport protein (TIGR00153 family)